MTSQTGTIYNGSTGEPLQGATVSLISNGNPVAMALSNSSGQFSVQSNETADSIYISHVGYNPYSGAISYTQKSWHLQPDYKELDPVELGTKKKTSVLWWILLAALLLKK